MLIAEGLDGDGGPRYCPCEARERRESGSVSMVLVRTLGLNVTFRTGFAGRADSGEDGAEVGRSGVCSEAAALLAMVKVARDDGHLWLAVLLHGSAAAATIRQFEYDVPQHSKQETRDLCIGLLCLFHVAIVCSANLSAWAACECVRGRNWRIVVACSS